MTELKRGTVLYLNAMRPGVPASYAFMEHRVALIDDLNRLSGPPSSAMSAVQREFIEDRMDPAETSAFASICYELLSEAVARSPGLSTTPDSAGIYARARMPKPSNSRQDLVERYNDAVGPPGPHVTALQQQFLFGLLEPTIDARYIQQCEEMIEARISLRPRVVA